MQVCESNRSPVPFQRSWRDHLAVDFRFQAGQKPWPDPPESPSLSGSISNRECRRVIRTTPETKWGQLSKLPVDEADSNQLVGKPRRRVPSPSRSRARSTRKVRQATTVPGIAHQPKPSATGNQKWAPGGATAPPASHEAAAPPPFPGEADFNQLVGKPRRRVPSPPRSRARFTRKARQPTTVPGIAHQPKPSATGNQKWAPGGATALPASHEAAAPPPFPGEADSNQLVGKPRRRVPSPSRSRARSTRKVRQATTVPGIAHQPKPSATDTCSDLSTKAPSPSFGALRTKVSARGGESHESIEPSLRRNF